MVFGSPIGRSGLSSFTRNDVTLTVVSVGPYRLWNSSQSGGVIGTRASPPVEKCLRDLHLVPSMNILPIWVVMKLCVTLLSIKNWSIAARSLRISLGITAMQAPYARVTIMSIMQASKPKLA